MKCCNKIKILKNYGGNLGEKFPQGCPVWCISVAFQLACT